MGEQMNVFGKSKSDAIAEIMAIESQIMQSGSVDSEIDSINQILTKLNKGEISPEQALELVKKMDDSRQNYH